MESYVLITKGHAGIIKAMKEALPRIEKEYQKYLERIIAKPTIMGVYPMPSPDFDSPRVREIAAMMMFKEVVRLSPSDAKFLTDQIKANKDDQS